MTEGIIKLPNRATDPTVDGSLNQTYMIGGGMYVHDVSGVVKPATCMCAFSAYASAPQSSKTGDATEFTILYDTEVFDLGGDFASPTFTAPANGEYLLVMNCSVGNLNADSYESGEISIVTSNRTYIGGEVAVTAAKTASNQYGFTMTVIADMDASDTAHTTVTVDGGTKSVNIAGSVSMVTSFYGYRIA